MASVTLEHLVKTYGDGKKAVRAVRNVNLEIRDREFIVIVGPSGCGKTTVLRMIAGLADTTEGTIRIDGRVVNDVLPKARDIAMVFQDYALYPHMSVFDNMAFGLKLQGVPRDEIRRNVEAVAGTLGIAELLERKPRSLSGGERQRVALGRAIVRNPKVFLFDEPLSNLDARLRVSMRTEIAKLHDRLQATMIFVTHDQVEAMTMGERICVMNDGEIMQVDEPLNIYNHPVNMFVASFIGNPPMNFITGRIVIEDGRPFFMEKNEGQDALRFDVGERLSLLSEGRRDEEIVLGIRPEDIHDHRRCSAAQPSAGLYARVELAEPTGAETNVYLNTGAHSIIARVSSSDRYLTNEQLLMRFDLSRIHLFDPATGNAIEQTPAPEQR
jgi:multiple sugar transport system ATP-binding protein